MCHKCWKKVYHDKLYMQVSNASALHDAIAGSSLTIFI
uniref:Uncharacterized protein n=1 Tax=Rhizophora mucronata TaxID=61149 RepID=A0A2P2II08_RHIMU